MAPEQLNHSHEPSAADAVVVRLMLLKARQLPIELVDVILDQAEYWPHESASTSQPQIIRGGNQAIESALLVSFTDQSNLQCVAANIFLLHSFESPHLDQSRRPANASIVPRTAPTKSPRATPHPANTL